MLKNEHKERVFEHDNARELSFIFLVLKRHSKISKTLKVFGHFGRPKKVM